MNCPSRLAILVSHPIQYFSPVFRSLAQCPEVDLTVVYYSLGGASPMRDPGFGLSVTWDVPLLEGYRYKCLANCWPGRVEGPLGCINPGIVSEIAKGSYDALIILGWASVTNWLAFSAATLSGVPWMLYGDSNSLFETNLPWLKRQLKSWLLGHLFRRTGAFLISARFNGAFYELYGGSREKFFDAPWAIDHRFFAQRAAVARLRRDEIRARLGIPAEAVVYLFVGKLIERKRPQDIIRALSLLRCKNPNITVAYAGDGKLRTELESQIVKLGLSNAFLLGFKNQTEMPEMYAMADAFVFPSSKDPIGLVTNEAMACGLPVIVSDRTGVWGPDSVARPGENAFVYRCGDVAALADAMQKLANDNDLRRRMGVRSSEIVRAAGYEKAVDGILEALRAMVRTQGLGKGPLDSSQAVGREEVQCGF